jgi:hypothetical protein
MGQVARGNLSLVHHADVGGKRMVVIRDCLDGLIFIFAVTYFAR